MAPQGIAASCDLEKETLGYADDSAVEDGVAPQLIWPVLCHAGNLCTPRPGAGEGAGRPEECCRGCRRSLGNCQAGTERRWTGEALNLPWLELEQCNGRAFLHTVYDRHLRFATEHKMLAPLQRTTFL